MKGFIIAAALLTSASTCSAASVSGIYLSKLSNHFLMIQMVKTPDGHVQGRLEEIILNGDGTLKDDTFPLDGAIDGDQITLKANELFGMGDSFSGTVDGTTLRLIMNNGQNTLFKSDMAGMSKAKADLQTAGINIIAGNQRAKAEAQRQADFQSLQSDAQAFEKLVFGLSDVETGSGAILADFKQRHDRIVGNIDALKAKWLLTPPEDKGSVEGDIQSQQGDMQALGGDFRAKESRLSGLYDQIRSGINDFKAKCANAIKANEPTVPQCNSADTYMAKYQASRAKVRTTWLDSEQMFIPKN